MPGRHFTVILPDRELSLSGIQVHEHRPGWVALSLPPTEHWTSLFEGVSASVRQRLTEPEFYEKLQRELSRRFLTRF